MHTTKPTLLMTLLLALLPERYLFALKRVFRVVDAAEGGGPVARSEDDEAPITDEQLALERKMPEVLAEYAGYYGVIDGRGRVHRTVIRFELGSPTQTVEIDVTEKARVAGLMAKGATRQEATQKAHSIQDEHQGALGRAETRLDKLRRERAEANTARYAADEARAKARVTDLNVAPKEVEAAKAEMTEVLAAHNLPAQPPPPTQTAAELYAKLDAKIARLIAQEIPSESAKRKAFKEEVDYALKEVEQQGRSEAMANNGKVSDGCLANYDKMSEFLARVQREDLAQDEAAAGIVARPSSVVVTTAEVPLSLRAEASPESLDATRRLLESLPVD